jgi:hypothetical protein
MNRLKCRQVFDWVGKRSATPLWDFQGFNARNFSFGEFSPEIKKPQSLRQSDCGHGPGMKSGWLDQALIEHRVCHLDKAGDVCTDDVVALQAILGRCFRGVLVDGDHDEVKPLVHFFAGPWQPH